MRLPAVGRPCARQARSALFLPALFVGAWLSARCAPANPAAGDSPRSTPTVRLVTQCAPAVVSLRTHQPGAQPNATVFGVGSGSIIHESGYVLTSAHVVRTAGRVEAFLADGRVLNAQLVAALPGDDLAILKLDGPGPFPHLPIGRSNDLLLGEPTLVIGNPDGLVQSVSTGIISGLNRATATQEGFLPVVVQTTAPINGGNSGGPLINALGEQIGVVCSKKTDADNIGFAIAADRVRSVFASLVAAEVRRGFRLGIEVEPLGPAAVVTAVRADWPAALAGVKPGDTLRRFGGIDVRDAVGFHLALWGRTAGEAILLEIARDGQDVSIPVTLADWPLRPAVAPETPSAGIQFSAYQGEWTALPDFASMSPAATGRTDRFSLSAWSGSGDGYGLAFRGYLRVPADGLYTLALRSDDGSRLWIGDELLVDNDGLHAAREAAAMVRLAAGLHPIRVEFFELAGEESLSVLIEGPELGRQEIPPQMLWSEMAPQP